MLAKLALGSNQYLSFSQEGMCGRDVVLVQGF